ncbi:MAG: FtsW/RodA/SpoVE family cell cycle protein [Candidatus Sungbacteria bacterium]|uniref:Probable peptidoglycan glycosyltransferase FtsW n=1 Tax=Candidatus Sungiibacteriota bacterium TaxID=2750080 RepID=A0A9D6LPM9_9BACT|nr:FtsW/RodA/SpoVE family cell cycle protein [Candidatus Sungbacteria bacterium]
MSKSLFFHDSFFLLILAFLLGGGLFLLSSASIAISERLYGSFSSFAIHQAEAVGIGIIAFCLMQFFPLRLLKPLTPLLFFAGLGLLVLVFFPHFGVELQGAKRWIHLLITFQPAEIVKLTAVLMLAWWIDRYQAKIGSFTYGFLPFLAMIGLVGGLVVRQPDLGTFGVICLASLAVFFVGGGRLRHVGFFIILAITTVVILSYISPYRVDRLIVFLHPATDLQGIGYQAHQATIAIGSGGFWGVGYGGSWQKFNYLPEPIGDSIFAIVAEEFGFFGGLLVIGAYMLLLWRGVVIARGARNTFQKLVVTGIISTIIIQAFINIGAISGILPLTGIPLPFISYGGTAIVMNLLGLGIVYQIAKYS